jgi:glycerol kinase
LCVDQQAALVGHQAFDPGRIKITYGTGCFVLGNIGDDARRRANGINTSVGWQIGDTTTYVLEGGAFSGGSIIDWLCKMQLAVDLADVFRQANEARADSPALLIPAFSGMGAPTWTDEARGCWLGMDLSIDRRDLAKSALEAIAFSVTHIVEAMGFPLDAKTGVRADGGLSRSPDLMQLQADLLNAPIQCSALTERTALGVGYLAGLGCGLWKSMRELPPVEAPATIYEPRCARRGAISMKYGKWRTACDYVAEMGRCGLFEPIGIA